jgi:hypothetical protein
MREHTHHFIRQSGCGRYKTLVTIPVALFLMMDWIPVTLEGLLEKYDVHDDVNC